MKASNWCPNKSPINFSRVARCGSSVLYSPQTLTKSPLCLTGGERTHPPAITQIERHIRGFETGRVEKEAVPAVVRVEIDVAFLVWR